ncbi:hypothetical protein QJ043_06975 [Olsenella sp. YH-ols2217]|uniref:Uncharacterized protein n=1 Tax=Kribbibacterium absianum TaxID=3044210 RepID=A0ABT6ZL95_9ACTN|nr:MULTISPECIES: hypothetical protein [unclassified Olsenella]MDJ1121808.1 hypothetical protein [Olsenella sp. YH-ols2216]MDJ1129816.1 hypothetical protein [Olsenella sp. YH-ols2217]
MLYDSNATGNGRYLPATLAAEGFGLRQQAAPLVLDRIRPKREWKDSRPTGRIVGAEVLAVGLGFGVKVSMPGHVCSGMTPQEREAVMSFLPDGEEPKEVLDLPAGTPILFEGVRVKFYKFGDQKYPRMSVAADSVRAYPGRSDGFPVPGSYAPSALCKLGVESAVAAGAILTTVDRWPRYRADGTEVTDEPRGAKATVRAGGGDLAVKLDGVEPDALRPLVGKPVAVDGLRVSLYKYPNMRYVAMSVQASALDEAEGA